MPVFQSLTKNIHELLRGRNSVREAARLLNHWALWKTHMQMREYIKEAKSHPGLAQEIARAPELLDAFLEHLKSNVEKHIDIDRQTFFDEDVVGPTDGWEFWQENGYSLERTEENYPRRIQVWRNIFNSSKSSYVQIISMRNSGYPIPEEIPYWYLWDVGNLDGHPGYPSYTGLRYIDKADQDKAGYMIQARRYLDEYVINRLNGNNRMPVPFRTTQWLSVVRKSALLGGIE